MRIGLESFFNRAADIELCNYADEQRRRESLEMRFKKFKLARSLVFPRFCFLFYYFKSRDSKVVFEKNFKTFLDNLSSIGKSFFNITHVKEREYSLRLAKASPMRLISFLEEMK